MKRITDPSGNTVWGDDRMRLEPGETPGRWDNNTQEFRKLDNGTYYFSAGAGIYHPLTLEQAEHRGFSTFSQ